MLPAFAGLIILFLQENQNKINRKNETRQWKLLEYKNFCEAYKEFRTASFKIELLLLADRKKIDINELQKAIISFDQAFNNVGYALMPFDISDMIEKNKPIKEKTLLKKNVDTVKILGKNSSSYNFSKIWLQNFVLPYYGGFLASSDDTLHYDYYPDSSYCDRYKAVFKEIVQLVRDSTVDHFKRINTLCDTLLNINLSIFKGNYLLLKVNKNEYEVSDSIRCLSEFFDEIKRNISEDTTKIKYFNPIQMKKANK
jgi:hypothetical protein